MFNIGDKVFYERIRDGHIKRCLPAIIIGVTPQMYTIRVWNNPYLYQQRCYGDSLRDRAMICDELDGQPKGQAR